MKVLLIDDEDDVREIVAFTLDAEFEVEIVEANSGNQAIEKLQEISDFKLIVCDYNMPNGNGGDVYKYLLDNNINIPYVFCSSDYACEHEEFNDARLLLAEVTKPNIFEGIQSMITAVDEFYKDSESQDISRNENEYCQASLELISNCENLPCDIYLKVGNKPIKTFNKGDDFSSSDLQKYKAKGVEHFLVLRSDSRLFVDYISSKIIKIFENDELSEQEKVVDAHTVIMGTVRGLGISDSVIRATSTSVEYALDLFDSHDELTSFKNIVFGKRKANYLTSHSIGVGFVAVGILKQTSWDSPDNRNKLVTSGFLHDLSIRIPSFTESIFVGDNELLGMKEHVTEAVDVLMKLQGIPEDVFKIISDHHERPDGSGVPRGVDGTQLTPLSALFILSHDIMDAVLKLEMDGKELNQENVLKLLEPIDYSIGKFKKIYGAFKQAKIFE